MSSLAASHPFMCMSTRSWPLKVRPHPAHATITCSSYACFAMVLRSSSDAADSPRHGRDGTRFRSSRGSAACWSSNFFTHCASWIEIDFDPYSLPHR
eukprot:CAMPEP_0179413352 /NCGR_PEP_ID=MMETSP0799-20121207/5045_1 /TAXON_ID=46947 /ORGANISM="Geminigera cryophila, Strain CCMP2564" /LENGTH=96 /DNA_ID=CAMNT_0021185803 /DNA_START=1 /DNA_END=291 /DNA_ORIENTATION=-